MPFIRQRRVASPRVNVVLRLVLALTAGLLALSVVFWLERPALSAYLFNITGEEDFTQQLKGGVSYFWLRLRYGQPQTDPMVPILQTGVNPFGVNTFLEQEVEESKVRRSLEMIHHAGFTWIRQEFPWEDIEIHAKGDFQDRRNQPYHSAWDKYDRIMALAKEYHIEVVARLDNPPAWSRSQGDKIGTLAPPDNFDDYADFVAAVVSRYKGQLHYIQIWNEPNIYPEWGEQAPNPLAYTRLLRTAYQRVKAINPQIVVLSAGLAASLEESGRNMGDIPFLEQMYAAGAAESFDILAVMGYGLWTGPTDRRVSPDRTNFSRPMLIRQIMVQHGDANKAIWIMEMGWNTVPTDLPAPYGRVTPEQQARYAVLAYQRVIQEWPWVGVGFTWFFRRPTDQEKNQPSYYFRLVEPDFTPMPVYSAIQAFTQQPAVVSVGYHQEDHYALNYSQGWQTVASDAPASGGSYKVGRGQGAVLSFLFEGDQVDLVTQPDSRAGSNAGSIQVTVDNAPPRLVSLRDVPSDNPRLPLTGGLSPGLHSLRLVVQDDAPVIVDALIVSSGPEFQVAATGGAQAAPTNGIPVGFGALLGSILILGAILFAAWQNRRSPR
ncbi:MAG: hypothetical protein EXR62_16070 [Chloroflexi bacterium]|nr:hypothetical protein [Chloroflexota bacterium]